MKNLALAIVVTLSAASIAPSFAHSANTAGPDELTLDEIQALTAVYSPDDGYAVLDLVAFYQPIYAVLMSEEAVHERIAYKVKIANETLEASNVSARINLVAVSPVFNIPDELGFNEQTTLDGHTVYGAQDLFSIYTLNDAPGHTENELYYSYGGDLVSYFRPYLPLFDGSTRFGTASQNGEISVVFDRFAHNSSIEYLDTTLIHEIGHNLGAGHEEGVDTFSKDSDAYAYSCGGKRTVMWSGTVTNTDGNHHHIFSSPDIEKGGEYCGEAGRADNASVLNRNAATAASRRHAPTVLGDVSIAQSSITAHESDGEFTVDVVRDGDLSESAAIGVLVRGDTLNTMHNLKSAYQFVEFEPGQSEAQVAFAIVNDAIEQGDMTASIELLYPNRLNIDGGRAELTLVDSPAGNPGAISIESPYRVSPGDTIEFSIVRTGGFDGELVVHVRPEFTLGQTVPYELLYPVTENIIFADGQERISFSVPTDAIDNFDADVAYGISANAVALDDSVANASVVIDAGVHSYSVSHDGVTPGASSVEFTVQRTGDTSNSSAVYLNTVDGSLAGSQDYQARSEWVHFRENEESKTISVAMIGSSPGTLSVELDTGESATATLTAADLDDEERQGAAFHPVVAGLMLLWALLIRRKTALTVIAGQKK